MEMNGRLAVNTSAVFGWRPRIRPLNEETVRRLARAGVGALELTIDDGQFSFGTLAPSAVRTALGDSGITVSGLVLEELASHNLASQSADVRGRALRIIRRACRLAADLDAQTVVIGAGAQEVSVPYGASLDAAAQTLSQAARYASEEGVVLLVENSAPAFPVSPVEFAALIDGIDGGAVAACLDVGNVLLAGQPYPENWILDLSHRVRLVHAKDVSVRTGVTRCCGDGDVAWDSCIAALHETGYAGLFVIESPPGDEEVSLDEGITAVERSLRFLESKLSRHALEEVEK
jgi:sugar phosphate isomerase/epimerase